MSLISKFEQHIKVRCLHRKKSSDIPNDSVFSINLAKVLRVITFIMKMLKLYKTTTIILLLYKNYDNSNDKDNHMNLMNKKYE